MRIREVWATLGRSVGGVSSELADPRRWLLVSEAPEAIGCVVEGRAHGKVAIIV